MNMSWITSTSLRPRNNVVRRSPSGPANQQLFVRGAFEHHHRGGIAPDPASYNYTEEHCGNNATFWLTIADCCGGENSTKCDYIPVMDYTPTSNKTEMDPPTNETVTSSPSVTASTSVTASKSVTASNASETASISASPTSSASESPSISPSRSVGTNGQFDSDGPNVCADPQDYNDTCDSLQEYEADCYDIVEYKDVNMTLEALLRSVCCNGQNTTCPDYTPTSNETEMDPPTNETSSPALQPRNLLPPPFLYRPPLLLLQVHLPLQARQGASAPTLHARRGVKTALAASWPITTVCSARREGAKLSRATRVFL
eukprot:g15814.t1